VSASQELYGLLVPLLDERLLVPRACVAEVTGFQPLQEMPGAPPWYLGIAAWNGRGIPVVSFEGACGKRIPVIGGTGANSTAEAIELTRAASDVGVDACLLVTPYYNKPTQEGLYRHFRAVAEAVPIPQILYNVPGRTACDLKTETVLRLAEIPDIVGLKDATGSLERGAELLAQCPPDFWLFSGEDAIAAELMLRGYRGVISVTANVAPKAMATLCEAALAGHRDQALALDASLQALHRDLFVEANPIPVKWACAEMGLIPYGLRLPLTPLSAGLHDTLRDAMRQLLDEGWLGPRDLLPAALASVLVPVDVLDTGPDLVVRAAMPGVKAEHLKITLSGNTLTLKGEVEAESEFEDATYLHRERRASAFTRSLTLPIAVEADHAQAVFRDGVLTLTLPKTENVRPKTIKVTTA